MSREQNSKRGLLPPHQAAPIQDRDRQEAAAIAGAKAEAKGLPVRANPYRQQAALRRAWESGWSISRQDRGRERINRTATSDGAPRAYRP